MLWSDLRDNSVSPAVVRSFTSMLALTAHSKLLFFSYSITSGRFVYLNPAFQDFFDLKDSEADYTLLFAMVHGEDQTYVEAKVLDCLRDKAASKLEFRVVRGGHQRWLRMNCYVHQERDETFLVGHAEDITALREHNDNLNEHNSKKNSILNILAHDLAGPIGNIANLSVLLGKETAALDNPKVHQYLDIVKKITDSSLHLIRDFLNQEFLETQGVKLVKRRVELVSRMRGLMEEYRPHQGDLRLQFSCRSNQETVYADIDEDKLLQAISNLISNSMKFTPDGGTISIDIEEKGENVLISVADTGVGIPEKFHAGLFDKFSEARRTGLKGEPSTGLGMSIIKTIVEWHQGKIWFESEENKGTTFYIEIPR